MNTSVYHTLARNPSSACGAFCSVVMVVEEKRGRESTSLTTGSNTGNSAPYWLLWTQDLEKESEGYQLEGNLAPGGQRWAKSPQFQACPSL